MVSLKPRDSTAQSAQKLRKHFDEEERVTYPPPGLINHGNTCFMNSVLQGLISTRLLADLVQFQPLPPTPSLPPIASRRSPQLTNQHGLGGQNEQPWVPGMPIGDVFVTLMLKTWAVQRSRRRENISPRDLLTALGVKYDQYLDFAQQDAHEFLRQLLDAMRMEEFDIIKKRQPPPLSQEKRHRRHTIKPPSLPKQYFLNLPQDQSDSSLPPQPSSPEIEDQKLTSFVDMIFGGKLTSILVCEKCKHISQTQEDFNDLSLSIKPDDYGKERKRGRFKMFAKRITALQSATLGTHSGRHRSSSVPPSPREVAKLSGIDELPIGIDPRRRSLDILAATNSSDRAAVGKDSATRETSPERDAGHSSAASVAEDALTAEDNRPRHAGFVNHVRPEKKEKKDKEDDSWVKLGRRISMSIRLGKDKERHGRPRDRRSVIGVLDQHSQRPREIDETASSGAFSSTASSSVSDVRHDLVPIEVRPSLDSVQLPPEKPKLQARHSDFGIKAISSPVLAQTSLSASRLPTIHHLTSKRPKSPQMPKPTPRETEYLRQILADVTPASSNPFAIFRHNNHYGTNGVAPSSSSPSAYALWLKMGQLPGIEECLRMFTAVEILDGENMVGCRRCWKIANGKYTPHPPSEGECEEDDDSDSEDNKLDDIEVRQGAPKTEEPSPKYDYHLSVPSLPSSSTPGSLSSSTVSPYQHTNLSDAISRSPLSTRETTPLSSSSGLKHYPSPLIFQNDTTPSFPPLENKNLPVIPHSTISHEKVKQSTPSSRLLINPAVQNGIRSLDEPAMNPRTRGVSIPSISTTAPESPAFESLVGLPNAPSVPQLLQLPDTPPGDSLRTPRVYHRRPKESDFFDSNCESSEVESDASAGTSVFDNSASSSPSFLSPDLPSEHSADHSKESSSSSKITRSKQVIMRAAYKRYLIGTPPPVLVIHLKRFQQILKTHMMSFSHGFKKLDDYVTFPEYLDLTPFLAPKKEDFGLGSKKSASHVRTKNKERCMYRLYAVVVHIGNMLGGHYVAYTALPGTSSVRLPPNPSTSPSAGEPTSNSNSKTPRQWAYISDTVVRLTTIEEVLKVKAYICMYERI